MSKEELLLTEERAKVILELVDDILFEGLGFGHNPSSSKTGRLVKDILSTYPQLIGEKDFSKVVREFIDK